MTNKISGLVDLYASWLNRPKDYPIEMIWLWCRRHEQVHKINEKCKVPAVHGLPELIEAKNNCINIGPFISEREANRLGELNVTLSPVAGHYKTLKPLGMKVES